MNQLCSEIINPAAKYQTLKCSCYQVEEIVYKNRYNGIQHAEIKHICNGTRERDECSCGGDRLKCTFYPEVRLKAAKEVGCHKVESESTQKYIDSELELIELKKKVKALETQNKALKKSNKNWRRKVQRLRAGNNEFETEEAEIESLLFKLNRLGYKHPDFKKELDITRSFIVDNDLLYELANYSKKFEEK